MDASVRIFYFMNTTTEENGIVTTRNENGDIIGQHNSGICIPRLQVGIDKDGSSVSSTGATIKSCRVISGLNLPRGSVAGRLSINPNSVILINAVVDEKPVSWAGSNSDIPMGIGVAGKSLHVSVNLGDDLVVGHGVDVELDIYFANVPRQVSLAGAAGGSQTRGAKALGLLFCQQALCLSGGTSSWCSSKLPTGQRLTARAR